MSKGIFAVDVGGTGLKAAVVDESGTMLSERKHVPTPHPCPPKVLVDTVASMAAEMPAFDRISIGFPGVVRHGRVLTAPHLGTEDWAGFELTKALSQRLGGLPARMINDAEMQGLAVIEGKGLELVLTLGTGAGTALFRDGDLMPHMELSHHPVHGDLTYDDYLGKEAFEEAGKKHWSKRVLKVVHLLYVLLHYDRLYIGGGNARHIVVDLPENVKIVSNDAGIEGGGALWRRDFAHV